MEITNRRRKFEDLLPWFVNNTLTQHDRQFVQQYLAEFPESALELAATQTLRQSIRENTPTIAADVGFDNLMTRIAQDKAAKARAPAQTSLLDKLSHFFAGFQMRPAYMAAACVMLVQAGIIGMLIQKAGQENADSDRYATYRSVPNGHGSMAVPLLRLTFKPEATEKEIRELLIDIGGAIVGGPSQFGDYLVLVEASKVEGLASRVSSNHIVENVTIARNHSN